MGIAFVIATLSVSALAVAAVRCIALDCRHHPDTTHCACCGRPVIPQTSTTLLFCGTDRFCQPCARRIMEGLEK